MITNPNYIRKPEHLCDVVRCENILGYHSECPKCNFMMCDSCSKIITKCPRCTFFNFEGFFPGVNKVRSDMDTDTTHLSTNVRKYTLFPKDGEEVVYKYSVFVKTRDQINAFILAFRLMDGYPERFLEFIYDTPKYCAVHPDIIATHFCQACPVKYLCAQCDIEAHTYAKTREHVREHINKDVNNGQLKFKDKVSYSGIRTIDLKDTFRKGNPCSLTTKFKEIVFDRFESIAIDNQMITEPIFGKDWWKTHKPDNILLGFRPRRKLSKQPKKSFSKSVQKRRKSKNKSKNKSKKRSTKHRRH